MNYNELQDNRHRVFVGTATIYLILAVSFAATIAYWVVLSGLENSSDLSTGWHFLLWLIVGVGAVSEIIKKVTLSTYRHAGIWFVATAVSVLTVMGTYAILNADRQDKINKASDNYQSGKIMQQRGMDAAANYAHAAAYDLKALQQQLDDVVCARAADCGGGRSISYAVYLKQKSSLKSKIADAQAYQRAMGTVAMGKQQMAGGGTNASSNPLLSDVASYTGASEKMLINLFYLAVTLLLEFAAYYIGGKVEEQRQAQRYTEIELLERKNKSTFGVTVGELMGIEDALQIEPVKPVEAKKFTPPPPAEPMITAPTTPRNQPEKTDKNKPVTASANETISQPKKEVTSTTETVKQEPQAEVEKVPFGFSPKPKPAAKAYSMAGASEVTAKRVQGTEHTDLKVGKTDKQAPPKHTEHTSQKARVSKCAHIEHTGNTQNPNTQNTQDTDTLYHDWEQAIRTEKIRPVARESRVFIQKRISGDQRHKTSMTIKQCGDISKVFMMKALIKGVLIENPKKAANQPKYLLKKD